MKANQQKITSIIEAQGDQFHANFVNEAKKHVPQFTAECRELKLTEEESEQYIQNVFTFCCQNLRQQNQRITVKSIKAVEKKFTFSRGIEEYNFQVKLCQFFLLYIEKHLGFTAPTVTEFTQIKQEQPILTCERLLNSDVHRKLYAFIENHQHLDAYLSSPYQHVGFFYLWLVLKEGIHQLKRLKAILKPDANIYAIDGHWLFEYEQSRTWLSPKAQYLFSIFRQINLAPIADPMKRINTLLQQYGLITPIQNVVFSDLLQALKTEYTLTCSPIEWDLSIGKHTSSELSLLQWSRLLEQKRPFVAGNNEARGITVRQQVAWKRAWPINNKSDYVTSKNPIDDQTIKHQTKVITDFTRQLTPSRRKAQNTLTKTQKHRAKYNRKESILVRRQLLRQVRTWLDVPNIKTTNTQANNIIRKQPWQWLIMAWFYKLLSRGGKFKEKLRLETIKAYVEYVATPFLTEFSHYDASLMTGQDWAEKLNAVADRMGARTKKTYVLYFAEFLIESDLVPDLCLSDLDIPVNKQGADTNLLTLFEADTVCDYLNKLAPIEAELTTIIFMLGFYCGLRRGEIAGLQFKDFHYTEDLSYFHLNVRPNKYRELKSSASARNLPLDVLLTLAQRHRLQQFLFKTKTKHTHHESNIFKDTKLLNEAFAQLTDIMKGVTGDNTIRFHHCRHSFTNWNIIRLLKTTNTFDAPFPFLQHPYFDNEACKALRARLKIQPYSRKRIWAISHLLGHTSPETTFSSYFHLLSFFKRARFATHQIHQELHHKYWRGEAINTEWGHLPSTSLKHINLQTLHFNEAVPFELERIKSEPIFPSPDITLDKVWWVIKQLGEGVHSPQIAQALNIDETLIKEVESLDQKLINDVSKKAKNPFKPLLDYANLLPSHVRYLEKIIKQFVDINALQNVPNATTKHLLTTLLKACVSGKDNLIRTTHLDATLFLLNLLSAMKIPDGQIEFRWYQPSVKKIGANDNPKTDFHIWLREITKAGLNPERFTLVTPKNETPVETPSGTKIRFSDDGKYLPFKDNGFVSIHFYQLKALRGENTYKSAEKTGMIFSRPRRNKVFICFLRLLVIYAGLE